MERLLDCLLPQVPQFIMLAVSCLIYWETIWPPSFKNLDSHRRVRLMPTNLFIWTKAEKSSLAVTDSTHSCDFNRFRLIVCRLVLFSHICLQKITLVSQTNRIPLNSNMYPTEMTVVSTNTSLISRAPSLHTHERGELDDMFPHHHGHNHRCLFP